MPNKNDLFELSLNKLEKTDLHRIMLSFISFRSAIVISLLILIGYVSISLLMGHESLRIELNDIFAVITELVVVLCLFYVAKISKVQGQRVQIFWLVTGIALLSYAIGDILWAIKELILYQQPFHSATSIFLRVILFFTYFKYILSSSKTPFSK